MSPSGIRTGTRVEPRLCDGASVVRQASDHCRADQRRDRRDKKAESIDPLSPNIGSGVAALCVVHLYDEAIRQSRKILEWDPNFAVPHVELGQALTQQHKHDEAIAAFRGASSCPGKARLSTLIWPMFRAFRDVRRMQ
jgi:hypothetical protein